MSEVKVKLGADLSTYYEELKKAETVTESQLQALANAVEDARVFDALTENLAQNSKMTINEAKRTAKIIIAEEKKIAAASAAAAKEAANARIAAEKEKRESVIKGLTVTFGGVVGDIEDLDGMLSQVGTSGLATFGAIGAAAGVMGAAVAAEVAVFAGITAALYSAADATGELDNEKKLLESSVSNLTKTVGNQFVPNFEYLIDITAGALLGIERLSTKIFELEKGFKQALETSMDFRAAMAMLSGGATEQYLATARLIEGYKARGAAEGSLIDQARDRAEQERRDAKQAENIHEAAMRFQDEAKRKTVERDRDRVRSAQEAAKRQEAAQTQLTAVLLAANREVLEGEDAINDAYLQRLNQISQLEKTSGDHALAEKARAAAEVAWRKDISALDAAEMDKAEKAREKEAADAQKARERETAERAKAAELQAKIDAEAAAARKAATESYVDAGITAAVTLAQAVVDSAEEGSAAQKSAAMVAFRANQAAALASIGINTAQAVTKAIADFGPPPSPLGIAGIVTASALGLAQAAAVAAQPPPSFHTGGTISTNPLAPDETMVVARKGEEIRTRQDQSAAAPVIVQMTYQHRVFDTFVADNMKQTGSPLRREISNQSGKLLGHRERAR